MERGGKLTSKWSSSSRTQIQKHTAISDDSDEEYRVEEDEIDDQSDDIVSLVGDALEEDVLSGFAKKKPQNRTSQRKNGLKRSSNRRRSSYDGKDYDYEDEDKEGEDDDYEDVVSVSRVSKSKPQNGSSQRKNGLEVSTKRRRLLYDGNDDDYEYENEEDEDDDYNYEDEEDEDVVLVSRVSKSKRQNGCSQRRKGLKVCTDIRRLSYDGKDDDYEYENEEDEEDYLEDEDDLDDEDEVLVSRVPKSDPKNGSNQRKYGFKKSTNRKQSLYIGKDDNYEDEEDDNDYEDEDDDEFTPDDLDSLEEDEFLSAKEKVNFNGSRTVNKKGPSKIQKRKFRVKTNRKPLRKKRKTTKTNRKSNCRNHSKKVQRSGGKGKRKPLVRKRKIKPCSDSDFVSSEASVFEYTISEEEREQIREADEFCRRVNRLSENALIVKHRPHAKAKGKEKVEDVKNDVGKAVCGICFTEEGKNTVRGTLNCCSHFFCFTCIMEWSKVESRCPLCKQRFSTISKPIRSATRVELRNLVVHVPERDQVYRPSEEELRNYLDPYENMICTECHEGGDDALMLLCDICDSPAHTYCVGLGREVPEGNWYCEGCRPSAMGTTQHSQAQHHTPITQRSGVAFMLNEPSSTYENMAEIDLNVTIPETPMTPLNEFLPSPRNHGGGNPPQPTVPTGVGVSTLSGRRRVHRLQYLISSNRLSQMAGISDRSSANAAVASLLALQAERDNELPFAENRISYVGPSGHSLHAHRLEEDYPFVRAQGGENIQGRQGLLRGQALVPGTVDGLANGHLQWGRGTNGSRFGLGGLSVREPLHPCSSRSNVNSDSVPSHSNYQVKEQIYSMVTNQLKSFCRDVDLGHEIVRQIARSSAHTVLAACGLDHRMIEVRVPPPICSHGGATWALEGGQTCPMKGCCQPCFNSFVEDAVRTIVNLRAPQLLGYRS